MATLNTRRFLLLVAALALVAAACGDAVEGDSTTTAPTSTGAAATEAPTTEAPTTTAAPTTTTTLSVPLETAPVVIAGDPLPESTESGDDAAIGLQAPQIAGSGFSGNEVVIAGGDGPQAIMFVAHWCPHCQNEVPAVQAWVEETGGVDGVEIIAVSTAVVSERPNYPPSAWFDGEGWSSLVMVDDDVASSLIAYGGRVIPFWVFLDAGGRVFHRIEGGVDVATLESVMNDLAVAG